MNETTLWDRVYTAITDEDEEELAAIRDQFGTQEALAEALTDERSGAIPEALRKT